MSARDPSGLPRWVESSDVPLDLRAALTDLGDSSDDARLARLEVRLAPLWGAPGGAAEPSLPRPEAASGAPPVAPGGASVAGVTLKLVGLALVGAGAIAAALAGSRAEPREPALREPAPRVAEPTASNRAPTAIGAAIGEPAPATTLPLPPPSSPPRAVAAPAPPPVRRPNPVASAEPASTVAEEARLLRSAREATSTSLDQALSLLAEHEQRFPRGELREERELFTIDVLARAGRTDEAIARVEHLRKTSPGSPHLGAAERLVSKTSVRR